MKKDISIVRKDEVVCYMQNTIVTNSFAEEYFLRLEIRIRIQNHYFCIFTHAKMYFRISKHNSNSSK